MNVRAGEWNKETVLDCSEDDSNYCTSYKTYPIIYIKVHEKYRRSSASQHNDIALLRVADDIVFNDFVQPICLPLDPSLWKISYTGLSFDVAGWG